MSETYSEQIDGLREDVTVARTEITRLRTELALSKRDYDATNAELAAANAEIARLTALAAEFQEWLDYIMQFSYWESQEMADLHEKLEPFRTRPDVAALGEKGEGR